MIRSRFICTLVNLSASHTTILVSESGFGGYIFYSDQLFIIVNLWVLYKYERKQPDRQTDIQNYTIKSWNPWCHGTWYIVDMVNYWHRDIIDVIIKHYCKDSSSEYRNNSNCLERASYQGKHIELRWLHKDFYMIPGKLI